VDQQRHDGDDGALQHGAVRVHGGLPGFDLPGGELFDGLLGGPGGRDDLDSRLACCDEAIAGGSAVQSGERRTAPGRPVARPIPRTGVERWIRSGTPGPEESARCGAGGDEGGANQGTGSPAAVRVISRGATSQSPSITASRPPAAIDSPITLKPAGSR